ncbi:MAG: enoyl-CoA hydratase/isomerase family protein [Synergistaceae bacterium]|nr:enoyl-CoA hydratase/isomerase family protein [Synergistaceae bacterium]
MENIIVRNDGAVSEITINRPQALNALNIAALTELRESFGNLPQETRVVILTGSGEKSFVAGADIREMKDLSAARARELARLGQTTFSEIERGRHVVIAAVNGYALGGGCELAMACDIRLASSNAKFGQLEVGLGIAPGFGGSQRLPRLVGKGYAKQMIFTGEMIDAAEALRIGLVNQVCEPAELMQASRALAGKIISKSFSAVLAAKEAIDNGLNMDDESAFRFEAEIFGMCFSEDDQREGMDAFLNKRQPGFK